MYLIYWTERQAYFYGFAFTDRVPKAAHDIGGTAFQDGWTTDPSEAKMYPTAELAAAENRRRGFMDTIITAYDLPSSATCISCPEPNYYNHPVPWKCRACKQWEYMSK